MRLHVMLGAIAVLASCTRDPGTGNRLPRAFVGYPETLDKHCHDGKAKVYDECSDQLEIFKSALARANAESKVLLISYGAEWCIWCHVLEAHLNGGKTKFRYTYGSADNPERRDSQTMYELDNKDAEHADALRDFVAKNFVVAHIDAQYAPNSDAVLETTDALRHMGEGIPFVFVVDKAGRFVSSLDHDLVEKRRDDANWYRGYNRSRLIQQLTSMRDAATVRAPDAPEAAVRTGTLQ